MSPFRRFFARRKFFINRALQGRLLLDTLYNSFLVVVVLSVAMAGPAVLELQTPDPNSLNSMDAAGQLLAIHDRYWVIGPLLLVLLGLSSIRTSHRVAGPLLRFSRVLAALREGRLPERQKLRVGDFLQHEMDELNDVVEALGRRFEGIDRTAEELIAKVKALADTHSGKIGPANAPDLAELMALAERLRTFGVERGEATHAAQ